MLKFAVLIYHCRQLSAINYNLKKRVIQSYWSTFIKIYIYSPSVIFLHGLISAIKSFSEVECTGYSINHFPLLALLKEDKDCIVILCCSIESGEAVTVISSILNTDRNARILFISRNDTIFHAEEAMRAGAAGCISLDADMETLRNAINTISQGHFFVDEKHREELIRKSTGHKVRVGDELLHPLSVREKSVFILTGQGFQTGTIAGALNLSAKTIETYLKNIRKKLGFSTTKQLRLFAIDWYHRYGND